MTSSCSMRGDSAVSIAGQVDVPAGSCQKAFRVNQFLAGIANRRPNGFEATRQRGASAVIISFTAIALRCCRGMCHVWTAPSWQGKSSRRRTWSVWAATTPWYLRADGGAVHNIRSGPAAAFGARLRSHPEHRRHAKWIEALESGRLELEAQFARAAPGSIQL